jgi:hypothetical protein
MQSQNEYANEIVKQRQGQHGPQQQSESRSAGSEPPEPAKLTPEEKILLENQRNLEKNDADRADKLGHGQQQPGANQTTPAPEGLQFENTRDMAVYLWQQASKENTGRQNTQEQQASKSPEEEQEL